MDRRQFLQRSILPLAAAATPGSAIASADGQAGEGGQVSLKDKFFGCIAGCHVGSALKGPCEGWTWQDCEAKFGVIDKLLPYRDYGNNWNREPGTTEDGVERQKMMVTAIIEKQDRATVDGVIAAVLKGHPRIGRGITSEIERGLKVAQPCKDYRELRVAFDKVYFGKGMPYPTSYANEVVTKAICVFSMVKGNTKEAMLAAVNMGRDTDCMSACAAGISGALSGAGSIPEEWIKQVDYATTKMPITNSRDRKSVAQGKSV